MSNKNNPYFGEHGIDRHLNEKYIKDKQNGFFVECGAYDGIAISNCLYFEKKLGWKGLNIEASKHSYKELVKNRPNCINVNYALSNENRDMEFSEVLNFNNVKPSIRVDKTIYWGIRSGFESEPRRSWVKRNEPKSGYQSEKYIVKCYRFDTLWKELKIDKKIDLFVLDIEGHEIEALDGILTLEDKYLPEILCIEHHMVGVENIDKKVQDKYIKGSIEAVDVVYIKRTGNVR